MLDIDGSAGGGQLVRSAISLSALTQTPIHITGIRQARSTPGLKAQHYTAIETAADLTDAEVSGLELGSEELTFDPHGLTGGTYDADVGTAGSVTLVFDTALPLACQATAPVTLTVRGGTDVKWSPPTDYYRGVKLPILGQAGLVANIDTRRRGFYPTGGGQATLRVAPTTLRPLSLVDRGSLDGIHIAVTASTDLANGDVAERVADAAEARLADADVDADVDTDTDGDANPPVTGRTIRYVETDSPGVAAVLRARYENSIAGFDAFGEKEKPAEAVGREAAADAIAFHETDAAVDGYLADQLLLYLALAGGRVAAPRTTAHVETSLDLFETFGLDLTIERTDERVDLVGPDDPLLQRGALSLGEE